MLKYTFCTLTQAEKNYSQLQKETLTIIFGVKKFHQFFHCQKFVILSDHKPLRALNITKGIPTVASAAATTIESSTRMELTNADIISHLPLPEAPMQTPELGDTILLLEHLIRTPVNASQI